MWDRSKAAFNRLNDGRYQSSGIFSVCSMVHRGNDGLSGVLESQIGDSTKFDVRTSKWSDARATCQMFAKIQTSQDSQLPEDPPVRQISEPSGG